MHCIAFSGGLDSVCAWYLLGKPDAYFCGGTYGPARSASLGEVVAVNKMLTIDTDLQRCLYRARIDFTPFMRDGVHHFQRELIICLAAWARGYERVSLGLIAEDVGDGVYTKSRLEIFQAALGNGFAVDAPYMDMSKSELVAAALTAGATPEMLQASHSCVNKSSGHCGQCDNCIQRAAAFAANGLLPDVPTIGR